jgi:hypothetical protein
MERLSSALEPETGDSTGEPVQRGRQRSAAPSSRRRGFPAQGGRGRGGPTDCHDVDPRVGHARPGFDPAPALAARRVGRRADGSPASGGRHTREISRSATVGNSLLALGPIRDRLALRGLRGLHAIRLLPGVPGGPAGGRSGRGGVRQRRRLAELHAGCRGPGRASRHDQHDAPDGEWPAAPSRSRSHGARIPPAAASRCRDGLGHRPAGESGCSPRPGECHRRCSLRDGAGQGRCRKA